MGCIHDSASIVDLIENKLTLQKGGIQLSGSALVAHSHDFKSTSLAQNVNLIAMGNRSGIR